MGSQEIRARSALESGLSKIGIWDWGLGFGTGIWDWDLGLGFGTGIWDWDWDLGFGIWEREGLWFGTDRGRRWGLSHARRARLVPAPVGCGAIGRGAGTWPARVGGMTQTPPPATTLPHHK